MKELTKDGFVAELIKALEDAERNGPQAPLSQETLARTAWDKLQYDFPLVSVAELQALAAAFDSASSPQPPMRLTDKFIDVVQEGSEVHREGTVCEEDPGREETLMAAYQFLYGTSLLGGMQRVLSVPLEDALELLQQVSLPFSSIERLESFDHEEEDALSLEEDAFKERKLPLKPQGEQQSTLGSSSWEAVVEPKLLHIASKVSYHKVSSEAAWKSGKLLKAAEGCLKAIRTHSKFLMLVPAAGAVATLLHDRAVSCPTQVESVLCALNSGLTISEELIIDPLQESEAKAALLVLGIGASLAQRLPAGQARRHVWMYTRDTLLPTAARLLERCEVQRLKRARKGGNISESVGEVEEEMHAIAVSSCLVEFYLINAPTIEAKPAKLQEPLISSGVYRGIVLAFSTRGREPRLEPLRRAVLACCAASPGLVTWAHAVPGFCAAWQEPCFLLGGEYYLHSSLHGCISEKSDSSSAKAAVASCLVSNLPEGDGGESGVPRIHAALQVVALVNAASRGSIPWGEEINDALGNLSVYLRGVGSDMRAEDPIEGEREDERKLRRSVDAQATLLASRQAQMLQPECLRMIKELRSKPGSLGKSD